MKVELLERAMVDSDLGVINAARCSFDKMTHTFTDKDAKLITYLAEHQHWTPFAHPQDVFQLEIANDYLLDLLLHANLAGFEWHAHHDLYEPTTLLFIRGSLYAWLTNAHYLPKHIAYNILISLFEKYPVSVQALFTPFSDIQVLSKLVRYRPSHVEVISNPQEDMLTPYTLRISAPIFVKRQLETHRRHFVMTDIEDFAQNEVSRRYVDTEPEFYHPQWRMQHPNKKQGSSLELIDEAQRALANSNYHHHLSNAMVYYNHMNRVGIAHEQSRMILPLSTYTTWWWTGSLRSWKRLLNLRLQEDVQSETRELAEMIKTALDFFVKKDSEV